MWPFTLPLTTVRTRGTSSLASTSDRTTDPESQSDFTEQVVSNVTEIVPGHQCYKIASIPSTVTAGTNATIQLEYWASYEDENNGKNETFYACADIVSSDQPAW